MSAERVALAHEGTQPAVPRLKPPRILASFLLLLGTVQAAGGGVLVTLGGSGYYLIAGITLLGSAFLLWRGRRSGAWIYAAFLVVTLFWALWEAGLDAWALVPRLLLPALLGLWVLFAALRGRLV